MNIILSKLQETVEEKKSVIGQKVPWSYNSQLPHTILRSFRHSLIPLAKIYWAASVCQMFDGGSKNTSKNKTGKKTQKQIRLPLMRLYSSRKQYEYFKYVNSKLLTQSENPSNKKFFYISLIDLRRFELSTFHYA